MIVIYNGNEKIGLLFPLVVCKGNGHTLHGESEWITNLHITAPQSLDEPVIQYFIREHQEKGSVHLNKLDVSQTQYVPEIIKTESCGGYEYFSLWMQGIHDAGHLPWRNIGG